MICGNILDAIKFFFSLSTRKRTLIKHSVVSLHNWYHLNNIIFDMYKWSSPHPAPEINTDFCSSFADIIVILDTRRWHYPLANQTCIQSAIPKVLHQNRNPLQFTYFLSTLVHWKYRMSFTEWLLFIVDDPIDRVTLLCHRRSLQRGNSLALSIKNV